MIVKTDAIVIKSIKYGDTSKILTVFTKDYGKFSLIAKGAFQPKSKFAGLLETLNEINISFYHKNTSELFLLSSADLLFNPRQIFNDSERYTSCLLMAESINLIKEKNMPNEYIYSLFSSYIKIISNSIQNPFSFFVKMVLELADSIGYEIQIDNVSKKHLDNINFTNTTKNILLNKLNSVISADEEVLDNIEFSTNEKITTISFFEKYFGYHLDKKIHYKSALMI